MCVGLEWYRYVQQNLIREIEGIDHLEYLDTLNVSNNSIAAIKGLGNCKNLKSLICTHNKIRSSDALKGLLDCPSLTVVDISHNTIEGPGALEIFAAMENLRVLNLMGTKLAKHIPNYRKTLISRCKSLMYLDDRPVREKERAMAEAFMQGGRDAERATRDEYVTMQDFLSSRF